MTPLRLSMFSALSFVNVFINCNQIGHYLIPLPIRKKTLTIIMSIIILLLPILSDEQTAAHDRKCSCNPLLPIPEKPL